MNDKIRKIWNDHRTAVVVSTASVSTALVAFAAYKKLPATIVTSAQDASVGVTGVLEKGNEGFDIMSEFLAAQSASLGQEVTADRIDEIFITYTVK